MGDNYASLAAKYGNFAVPAVKIIVDSTDVVAEQKFAIENLSVSLALRQAGSAHFNIVNVFELKSRTFIDIAKQFFKLGNIIKVEIGYASETIPVFQGYISELCFDFGEMPYISVTALDVTRLLMDTVHQNCIYDVSSYSDAFQKVMEEFSGFYSSLDVENTDNVIKKVVQQGSSYSFIQDELCAKADREFLVCGGTVYFRTPAKVTESVVSLNWGEGLISFQQRKSQCNYTIRVYGRADNKKDQIVKESSVKTADSSTDINIIKEYKNYSLVGESAIQKYINKLAGKQKAYAQGGSGTCIGLPELFPGKYIKLGNLDSDSSKEYYIKSVTHSVGSGGYTSQFEVEGCKN